MKRKASLFSNRGAFTLLYTEKENFFKIPFRYKEFFRPLIKKASMGKRTYPNSIAKMA